MPKPVPHTLAWQGPTAAPHVSPAHGTARWVTIARSRCACLFQPINQPRIMRCVPTLSADTSDMFKCRSLCCGVHERLHVSITPLHVPLDQTSSPSGAIYLYSRLRTCCICRRIRSNYPLGSTDEQSGSDPAPSEVQVKPCTSSYRIITTPTLNTEGMAR
jgi:hypothetical protein